MTITPPLTQDYGDWGVTWDTVESKPDAILQCSTKEAVLASALAHAWRSTGRQYGYHTATLRPCLTCGCHNAGSCGCHWYDRIDLDDSGGSRPVTGVTFVKVDGVELDKTTDYGVTNNRWLLRTPANETWPVCQDEALSPAPLEIRWTWGIPPSADLLLNGVYPLIIELARAEGGGACSLDPSIVRSAQREGVSFAFISDGGAWKTGETGNARIDAAFRRAWPLGPNVQVTPGITDPLDLIGPEFVKFERAT